MPTVFRDDPNDGNINKKRKTTEISLRNDNLFISHITIYQSGFILASYLVVLELIFLTVDLLIRVPFGFFISSVNPNEFFTISTFIFLMLVLLKIIVMMVIVLQWLDNYYEVRAGKVIYKTGFFKRTEREFDCPDVAKISLSEGFWGRLFHFGTITISVKISGDSFTLSNIPNPHRNLKLLQKALNTKRVNITMTDDLIEDD